MNEYPVLFSELDCFGNHFGIKQSGDFDAFLEALDEAWLETLYKSENDEHCITGFPTFYGVDFDKVKNDALFRLQKRVI